MNPIDALRELAQAASRQKSAQAYLSAFAELEAFARERPETLNEPIPALRSSARFGERIARFIFADFANSIPAGLPQADLDLIAKAHAGLARTLAELGADYGLPDYDPPGSVCGQSPSNSLLESRAGLEESFIAYLAGGGCAHFLSEASSAGAFSPSRIDYGKKILPPRASQESFFAKHWDAVFKPFFQSQGMRSSVPTKALGLGWAGTYKFLRAQGVIPLAVPERDARFEIPAGANPFHIVARRRVNRLDDSLFLSEEREGAAPAGTFGLAGEIFRLASDAGFSPTDLCECGHSAVAYACARAQSPEIFEQFLDLACPGASFKNQSAAFAKSICKALAANSACFDGLAAALKKRGFDPASHNMAMLEAWCTQNAAPDELSAQAARACLAALNDPGRRPAGSKKLAALSKLAFDAGKSETFRLLHKSEHLSGKARLQWIKKILKSAPGFPGRAGEDLRLATLLEGMDPASLRSFAWEREGAEGSPPRSLAQLCSDYGYPKSLERVLLKDPHSPERMRTVLFNTLAFDYCNDDIPQTEVRLRREAVDAALARGIDLSQPDSSGKNGLDMLYVACAFTEPFAYLMRAFPAAFAKSALARNPAQRERFLSHPSLAALAEKSLIETQTPDAGEIPRRPNIAL